MLLELYFGSKYVKGGAYIIISLYEFINFFDWYNESNTEIELVIILIKQFL